MIASVTGDVTVRRPDHVVVEAAGVGYRLAVSTETLRAIPAIGNEVGLHAHLISRDDGISLYGFATEEERDLFLMLISVSGIGPKVGLAALSGGAVRELLRAIADGRREALSGGARDRQANRGADHRRASREGRRRAHRGRRRRGGRRPAATPAQEARDGLLGLGYTPEEVERLLDAAEGETAEELIGAALRAGAAA